jgi:hypothetical protein
MNIPIAQCVFLAIALVFTSGCKLEQNSEKLGPKGVPTLTINPTILSSVQSGPHEISKFDRERYFRIYQFPGCFGTEINKEFKALEAPPGRGLGPGFGMEGNPLVDPVAAEEMSRVIKRWDGFAKVAQADFPSLAYAMAGSPQGWPKPWLVSSSATAGQGVEATMRAAAAQKGLQPSYFGAAADLIAEWLTSVRSCGGLLPTYYSVINEPDASYDQIPAFIAYHRTVAAKLKESAPEVLMTGPCTAWGYPGKDFRRWDEGWEGKFIDEAGDTIGAYDFHFYSKGYWAFIEASQGWKPDLQQDNPSLFAVQKTGVGTIWEFGRLQAFLDMLATRHLARWAGEPPAVIVSEFGHQGIHPQKGPWENEFKSLLYMNTVVRMWMTFFGRPEVKLTVPFITPRAGKTDDAKRGQTLYNRPGFPQDDKLEPTPFIRFYEFFRGFNGARVVAGWKDPEQTPEGFFSLALRDGNKLRVLLHNGRDFGSKFEAALALPAEATLLEARSLRWEGPLPARVDPQPQGRLVFSDRVSEWSGASDVFDMTLQGEETLLLVFDLGALPPPDQGQNVQWQFASVPVGKTPNGESMAIAPPRNVPARAKVRLRLGVARDGGFPSGITLLLAGLPPQTVAHPFSVGVTDYHGCLDIEITPEALSDGVCVALPDGGRLTSAVWEVESVESLSRIQQN